MRTIVLAIALSAVSFAPLQAEKKVEPAQPVDTFLLTDNGFEKYRKATASLVASAATIKKEMPRETKSEDDSTEGVIKSMTAQCEKVAVFKSTVNKAELTCREYALTTIVLMQASILGFGVEREGEEFYKRMPEATKTLRANVKFAIANKEAITKLNTDQRKAFQ